MNKALSENLQNIIINQNESLSLIKKVNFEEIIV